MLGGWGLPRSGLHPLLHAASISGQRPAAIGLHPSVNPAATSPAARLLSEVTSAQPHLSVFLFPLSLGILYLGGWVFLVYFSIKKTKQNKKEVREKGLVCKVGFCFVNLLYIVFICRYFFFKDYVCDSCTVVFYKEESVSQGVCVKQPVDFGQAWLHTLQVCLLTCARGLLIVNAVFWGFCLFVLFYKSAEMFLSHFR